MSSQGTLIGNSAYNRTMEDFRIMGTQPQLLTRNRFNLILGACLFWGFAVNAIICLCFTNEVLALLNAHAILFLIGYIVLCFAGIFISNKSSNPGISFLGYNMVVLPLGAVLSILLTEYPQIVIGDAFVATAVVALGMVAISSAKPEFFFKISHALSIALIITIVVELVLMLFGVHLGILDWIIALIFSGYIGVDWARAQKIPPTTDNAVDCACCLYVDIINLFVRLLRIMGRSN